MDSQHEPFLLTLSTAQTRELAQAIASETAGTALLRLLLTLAGSLQDVTVPDLQNDDHYDSKDVSQSVIHSLIVLSRFAPGKEYGVRELAAEIVLNATTTMRYLKTWVTVGALEQDGQTHRYRLAACWTY